jgi:signal transduction histidine kinase
MTPALIGKNQVSEPDADGKLFRKEIVEVANTKGTGWVNYKYKNPTSGAVEPKTSYVKKQGDLIIIAGVYAK